MILIGSASHPNTVHALSVNSTVLFRSSWFDVLSPVALPAAISAFDIQNHISKTKRFHHPSGELTSTHVTSITKGVSVSVQTAGQEIFPFPSTFSQLYN